MKTDIKNKIATNGYKIHVDTCEGQLPDNITLIVMYYQMILLIK